ncbi:c-type cytochrome [Agaribacter flavus]|uniref:C-type cytochrome n=1 Tax=Agaribacter flavus TaxID=1902781 RepID=A0ABV7FLD3_9ALTE
MDKKVVTGICSLLVLSACKPAEEHPGKAIWEETCKVCHSVGLAGSPKFGDVKAWSKRIARGKESLYQHALEGWGDMPAKGGNPALSDEQVKLAVDYMVANSSE